MRSTPYTAAYAAILLLGAALLYSRPNYGWDVLPYSAVALSVDIADPDSVHAMAYEAARREIRPARYALLVDTTNAYRRQTLRDADFFHRELSFYSVKPLFIATVYGLHRLGFSLPRATVLPSLISFVLIGALLLAWTRRFLPEPYAAAVSLSVLLAPFILQNAAGSTPDLPNALLLLTGTYCLIEGRFRPAGMALLATAVLVRPDALLFVIAMAVYLDRFRIVPRHHIVVMVACAGLATALILLRHEEVVSRLFIVRPDIARAGEDAPVSFVVAYLDSFRTGLIRLALSAIWLALALALVTLYARTRLAPALLRDESSVLILVLFGHIGARFLLHPTIEHRFLIADYLLLWIVFLSTMRDLLGASPRETRAVSAGP